MPNPKPKKPPHMWKKGQSGNPKGGSKRHQLYGEISKLTHEQIALVGSHLLENGFEAMKALAKDPKSSMLQVWTATLILKSMNSGDSATFDRILNRIVGRVKEDIVLQGPNNGPIQVQTMEQMQAQLAAIRASNEEMGDD